MGKVIDQIQYSFKSTSNFALVIFLKLLIGGLIGLTLALSGQQIFNYSNFSLFLVIVTTYMAFFRLSRSWGAVPLLVFGLICVLTGLLLRMYILIAPGA